MAKTSPRIFVAGVTAALLVAPPAAVAQKLEEIVVTATKREISAQTVPIPLTGLSAEQIERLGITSTYDLPAYAPGLQLKPQFGITSPDIVLRGVGSQSFFPNTISPVGFYSDGVYIGQSIVQGFQLFDVERVEVLRGPQGTLFGRNTTGGLVNVISRKPRIGEAAEGYVEIGAGDFGAISANAAAAAPVGDQSAVRFAVLHQESDGAFDNVFTQRDDGAIDLTSARALLRWQPTEPLDVLLNARWGRNRGEIRPQKPAYPAASTLPPSSLPPAYQPPIDNCPQGAPTDGSFRSGCSDQFGFGLTDTPGFHDTQTSFTSIEDVDTHGFSAEVNWKLGRHTLTSVTAWDTADSRRYNDTDGNELALLHQTDFVDTDFYSQELRLASNYEGAFNWIGGAYFYGDEMDSQFMFDLRDHGAGLGGLIPPLTPTGGFGASTPVGIAQNVHQETESWAMFGEGTYSFAERWEATLGLRVTGDERQAEVNSFVFNSALVPDNAPVSYDQALDASAPPALGIPFPLTLISSTSVEKSWTKWSGRAALKYDLADDQMMFLSVSHGFRGGEFNGGAIFGAEQAVITDPEFVDSVDLGYKGRLLDDRVQLNATAFYMEITDQQVQVFTPAGAGILPTIVNAGESTIKGLELDVQWRPLEAWFFMFSTAYLDAEFRKFFDPTINLDRSGNALPDSPEWTFDGVARYEVPIGSGRLALQVDGRWQDDVFFTAENNPALVQDSFGVVNFRGSYTFPGERFMASVFVRNAFDEEYLLGAYDTTNAFAANIFLPADPRTYGIALRYTW